MSKTEHIAEPPTLQESELASNTKANMAETEKEHEVEKRKSLDKTLVKPVTQANLKSPRFWAILIALGFTGLLTALDATITSTALPSIVEDLGGGDLYIWAIDGYLLTLTSLQPLYGQLANLFGRRWPLIFSVATFVLGSGICGGASNMTMLVAGRIIQGIGGAGIGLLIEVVIADLVPLRQRGNYFAVLFGLVALGTALGPFFGGLIVTNTTWRWVFWLNLPVGGFAFVFLILFLQVKWDKKKTLASKLSRVDWTGNFVFIGAATSILIALSWAGAVYPWSSYRILVPLIVGFVGMGAFLLLQGSPKFCPNPTVPLHLLSNRTTATVYGLTFMHGLITLWVLYFLPVYFQGVRGSTAQRSGVQLLPTILTLIPFGALGGGLLTKFGRYKQMHFVAFAAMVVGIGLLILLDEKSSTGAWVGYQMIVSAGAGLILASLLPAVLAPLAEADVAQATAAWSFMRCFGMTWGTAIAGTVFNNRFDALAKTHITSKALRDQVTNGHAYEHATKAFVDALSQNDRHQFAWTLNESLRRGWEVGIAFAAIGFLMVAFEKQVPLRNDLETEYGMENPETKQTEEDHNDHDSA
ncbi:uncharacterized protein PV06_08752 [Exophiala oligosperma]|uniref:Major facilitator superfamily (MFS) profile domain-containing protein n=1 Tax=Exophiala oligosperma TaxID=215243 RepID=A0A0D2AFJ4_9EURO|nr:uncharacterized protein PV06_08752 [Exophiala oligosperma]KIW38931.1 hypothetical protein PV06_08752 [Exophiala oligosperma]